MRNYYNNGWVGGLLAEAPKIEKKDKGGFVVSLVIVSLADEDDTKNVSKYRNKQSVKISAYTRSEKDLEQFRLAEKGIYCECKYWVRSYTWTDKDGNEQISNSLYAEPSDIDIFINGVPYNEPPIDQDDHIPPMEDQWEPDTSVYIKVRSDEYSGPDYDFWDTSDIEDAAYSGDAEARWYGTKYRGLDYDDFDDIVY